ncbi:MAG TPA: helix-turn-helix transcriptional regulator [Longimicrobiales bacterium]|nr:helix-turn-helix transcriptional regulator [Longimicrobiales bacterium]
MTPKDRALMMRAIETAAGGAERLAAEGGVSYTTLRGWATGRRNPTDANRRKLARVLRRRAQALTDLADRLDGA